ncbi:transcriptional regulator of RNA polII, SAGA, subunit-domain-containing protein [Jimgerdemannia flammicorona]|uniref:Transcriptional regulator of RNA polII, SAGA, subunit-domain-containing protein n=1 Tax=Jimgerdemannia flammicorona TaxID=994334 RepID=A0A433QDC4_9FUNG|nr:transcriptional regulator of RNA polII, SAGA, subunit-domain-containing protein [Jimgerdemannia flammicorona]
MPTSTVTPPPPSAQQNHGLGSRPAVPTTANGRQDLLALKQQLADALGDYGPQYWDALRDFVTGKLNRQEFDFYANLYLSRQNVYPSTLLAIRHDIHPITAPLHNAFILATIHNAQKDAPPPANQRSVGWQKRKRGNKGEPDGAAGTGGPSGGRQDPKRKKMKRDVMSLGKAERERIKGLAKPIPPRISKMPLMPILKDDEKLPPTFNADFSRGLFTPLCYDSKELPNFDALRDRMTTIALEHGLMGGAADDSVEAMIYALEVSIFSHLRITQSHIKSIISNVIYKIRANRSMGVTLSSKPLPDAATSTDFPMNAFAGTPVIVADPTIISSVHTIPTKSKPIAAATLGTPSSAATGTTVRATTPHPTPAPSTPPPRSLASLLAQHPPMASRLRDEKSSITPRDLAFSFEFNPHVLTENPINAERLTSLMEEEVEEGEEEEDEDEEEGGEGDEDVFII